jgi:ribosomal protein L29
MQTSQGSEIRDMKTEIKELQEFRASIKKVDEVDKGLRELKEQVYNLQMKIAIAAAAIGGGSGAFMKWILP